MPSVEIRHSGVCAVEGDAVPGLQLVRPVVEDLEPICIGNGVVARFVQADFERMAWTRD